MEAKLYNREGKEVGKVALPASVFGVRWNADLVHQVVTSMRSNARVGTADTQGRGEVRGGGKKPWRQKGTGRARHGSSRSPIWRGGGVTHGPLAGKNYAKKINQKTKLKALGAVLSRKWRDGEVIFVDELTFAAPKTREAQAALKNLSVVSGFERLNYARGNRVLVALPAADQNAWKSWRNLPTARVMEARELNPLDLLNYQYLLLIKPEASVKALETRLTAAKK